MGVTSLRELGKAQVTTSTFKTALRTKKPKYFNAASSTTQDCTSARSALWDIRKGVGVFTSSIKIILRATLRLVAFVIAYNLSVSHDLSSSTLVTSAI